MKKYILVSVIALIGAITLIILFMNGNFDTVKSESVNSFNDLLISGLDKKKEAESWIITMPDQTSKLVLNANNKNTIVSMTLDIKPFLEAGLKVEKLPSYITYNLGKSELYITSLYGNKKVNSDGIAIDNIFNNIVTTYRDKLGYHSVLGHFGLSLDNGNAFEYAKNISKNDKDIVIVLNPDTLKKASVDVEKVTGFKYMNVTMDNGEIVPKMLKVFNLKEVSKCLTTNQSC